MYRIIICCLLFCALPAQAIDSVHLKGLFGKQAAVLMVDGKNIVLKLGESQLDITLLKVMGDEVLIDVEGKQRRIGLSRQVGGVYKKPQKKTFRVASKEGGHFWAKGTINGFAVDFIVDTGATMISMNLSTAKRLGLDYEAGERVNLSTANGISEARQVQLKKVTVGGLEQYNIAATVSLDDALPATLLGNSFLQGVNISIENGVLVLESKI